MEDSPEISYCRRVRLSLGHRQYGKRLPGYSDLEADSGNNAIFADWSELYIGSWGAEAMQIIVDPISQAKVGKTVITANIFADVGVRRPNLFVVSTDSGAQ
jgi:hypothetical protein